MDNDMQVIFGIIIMAAAVTVGVIVFTTAWWKVLIFLCVYNVITKALRGELGR